MAKDGESEGEGSLGGMWGTEGPGHQLSLVCSCVLSTFPNLVCLEGATYGAIESKMETFVDIFDRKHLFLISTSFLSRDFEMTQGFFIKRAKHCINH